MLIEKIYTTLNRIRWKTSIIEILSLICIVSVLYITMNYNMTLYTTMKNVKEYIICTNNYKLNPNDWICVPPKKD